ncbi:MAG TPA: ATP-grasp domain-containing protein [Usitatibacter sp.]|nr:ATP-grasp domain-containing protein [Usitatibacter sp.]
MQIGDLSLLRRRPRDRLPVVLLGGLNVVRALGLGGIPVIVASPDDDEPGLYSRYYVARWPLPALRDADAVLESLESLAARLRGVYPQPVPLFFSNDEYLHFVNEFRHRLAQRFRMLLNDHATTEALLDKDRFAQFAVARGLPVPRALAWDASLSSHRGPVLVKPASKHGAAAVPGMAELFRGAKAIVRDDGAAAWRDPALQALSRHLVFHEYIPGDDGELWCFDGVADEHGRVLGCHTGRKLRCAPPLTGESSYIELRRHPQLEAIARDISAAIPLRGIFNMDFKRDASTGRFYLLEINARCNLWNYIGACNGANLVKIYYDYLLRGAAPAQVRYRRRFRWINFKLDRAAYRALAGAGKLDRARWVASLLRPKIYSLFAWRDPRPFLRHALKRAHGRMRRGPIARPRLTRP